MDTRERNYLRELWYNRPWRYVPAVIRYMKAYSPKRLKKNSKSFSYKKWLRNCLYINWQVAFKHGKDPVYDRCTKCLCFRCKDKKCRRKNCGMCDKLSKRCGDYGMVTTACGHCQCVKAEEAYV